MLGTYIALVLVAFLIFVVSAIVAGTQTLDDKLKTSLTNNLNKYDPTDDKYKHTVKVWDTVQEEVVNEILKIKSFMKLNFLLSSNAAEWTCGKTGRRTLTSRATAPMMSQKVAAWQKTTLTTARGTRGTSSCKVGVK